MSVISAACLLYVMRRRGRRGTGKERKRKISTQRRQQVFLDPNEIRRVIDGQLKDPVFAGDIANDHSGLAVIKCRDGMNWRYAIRI